MTVIPCQGGNWRASGTKDTKSNIKIKGTIDEIEDNNNESSLPRWLEQGMNWIPTSLESHEEIPHIKIQSTQINASDPVCGMFLRRTPKRGDSSVRMITSLII